MDTGCKIYVLKRDIMINAKSKWENIYSGKQDDEFSWFQEDPEVSVMLIEKYSHKNKKSSIIDVGGLILYWCPY